MSNKDEGLINKYEVKKLTNLSKDIDAIVLEFDDPLSHDALFEWAHSMREAGFNAVYLDVIKKLKDNGGKYAALKVVEKLVKDKEEKDEN